MSKIERNAQRYLVSRDDMTVHLIEDRRADVSPWGIGNSKVGPGVFTYSKLPGHHESCPGSTLHCEQVCYAKRALGNTWLRQLWKMNSDRGGLLPELPPEATLVRGHVSGDFDSIGYVEEWIALALSRSDVKFWFYTRSWRVPNMLPTLEKLRQLENVQLWASMDRDCEDPPAWWRKAWLDSDPRINELAGKYTFTVPGGDRAPVCPEESGTKENCVDCRYCFEPHHGDLVFLEHAPK